MAFRGHFEHSLDAKNRLSIPARFRAAFADGLVLAKDSEACVAVWTPEAHERDRDRRPRRPEPARRRVPQAVARFFQGNSFDLELDSAGRVTLPAQLLAHAGIEKDVVVAGVGDHLEVWDARRAGSRAAGQLDADIGEVTERLGHPS